MREAANVRTYVYLTTYILRIAKRTNNQGHYPCHNNKRLSHIITLQSEFENI